MATLLSCYGAVVRQNTRWIGTMSASSRMAADQPISRTAPDRQYYRSESRSHAAGTGSGSRGGPATRPESGGGLRVRRRTA